MTAERDVVVEWAVRLANALPAALVYTLVGGLDHADDGNWAQIRTTLLQAAPQPAVRALLQQFVTAWSDHAPTIGAREAAMALSAAVATAQQVRAEQAVDLVWTGPALTGVAMRRTDQALLETINAATRSLLVVSFAVYKIPAITQALIRAAGRSVAIHICVEAPEPSGQKMAYDTIMALGPDVARSAAIYIWPKDQRTQDASGRTGSLHAKCAVADERWLFVSSANLTAYALSINMELGVVIEGGPLPATVAAQFNQMIERGVLQRVPE